MGAAVGQVPRELVPGRSVHDLFGAELRYWREQVGLSQVRLGAVVCYSGDVIGKVEKAERWPSRGMAEACDAALGTGGALGRMWPTVEQQRCQELQDWPGWPMRTVALPVGGRWGRCCCGPMSRVTCGRRWAVSSYPTVPQRVPRGSGRRGCASRRCRAWPTVKDAALPLRRTVPATRPGYDMRWS